MSERALGDLVGRTRLDNSQLKRGAAEAKAEISGIGKSSEKVGNVIEGAFGKASSKLTSQLGPAGGKAQQILDDIGASALKSGNLLQTALVGGTVAAAAGLGALAVKGVGAFASLTGEIRGLQRVTGASAQDASALTGVLAHLGIDAGAAQKGFFLLSKTIENTPEKLDKVGVAIARNRDNHVDLFKTLENVSDAYQKVGAGAEGNKIAFAAFGKSAQVLLPLLSKSREELDKIKESLARKGLIFDQKALDEGKQFSLEMRDLGESVKGLEISLGRALVPPLTKAAAFAAKLIDDVHQVFNARPPGGAKDQTVGGDLGKAFQFTIGTGPESAGGRIARALGLVKKGHDDAKSSADKHTASEADVAASMEESARQAEEEAKAFDDLLQAQVSLVDSTLGLQGAQDAFARAQDDVKEKTAAAAAAIRDHGAGSKEAADATRDLTASQHDLEDAASRMAHATADQKEQQALANGETFTAEQKTEAYKTALLDAAKQIGGPVGEALTTLANQIQGMPPLDLAISNYNEFLRQLDEIARRFDALADKGEIKVTGVLPGSHNVPVRMAGGPVIAGRPYVVGEKRPELFVPNVSGRIVPRVPPGWGMNGADVPAPAAPAGGTFLIEVPLVVDGREFARTHVRFTSAELERYRVGRS